MATTSPGREARDGPCRRRDGQEQQAVDNEAPVFEADPEPEVLDIYEWRPGVTHLVSTAVHGSEMSALAALEAGRRAGEPGDPRVRAAPRRGAD